MREQIEVALKHFLEQPTSQNKQTLESLIQTYPDFFIEKLGANMPAQRGANIAPEGRSPLARTRYTNMPFHDGIFIWDSDVYPIDELPDDERMILHFRQKQEFKGQKPFGVVTLRVGTSENAAENAGKYRRGYRDNEGLFWNCDKNILLELVGNKVELVAGSYMPVRDKELQLVRDSEERPDLREYRDNWLHPFLEAYDDYRVEDIKNRFLTSRTWADVGSTSSASGIESGSNKVDWLEQFCTPDEEWLMEPTWKDFLVDLEAGDPDSPLGAKSVRKVCLVNSQFPGLPVTIRTLTLDQTTHGGTPTWGDGPMPEDPKDRWIIENTMPDMSPQFFRRLAYFLDCTFES
jgi:hypothetical protein